MGAAMKIEDFMKDLPTETQCCCCSGKITGLEWGVGRFGARDWMGICVVRCAQCSWVKVAAAGTSHEAHHRAQMMRLELMMKIEGRGWKQPA